MSHAGPHPAAFSFDVILSREWTTIESALLRGALSVLFGRDPAA